METTTSTPTSTELTPLLPLEEVAEYLSRSEYGDARLCARLFKDRWLYDHSEQTWYYWDSQHWRPDKKRNIYNTIVEEASEQYLFAAAQLRLKDKEDEQVGLFKNRAARLRMRARLTNVHFLTTIQPELSLMGNEWDRDPYTLAVGNGVLNLHKEQMEFRNASPSDLNRTFAPAVWQGLDCSAPRWEQFLLEVFDNDKELIQFVQRLFGYGITGLSSEHICPVLWGAGRNGKDTMLNALAYVLGDYTTLLMSSVLVDVGRDPNAATPHLYMLRGKRLAWVNETNANARLNAAQLKWLTGGGKIVARPIYGQPVELEPQHLLMLITNHKPHISDPDDFALWKRMAVIPFTEAFVDDPSDPHEHLADHNLDTVLKNEASGILAWLVRGCLDWQQNGLKRPVKVAAETNEYRTNEDTIATFIEDACETGSQYAIGANEIYTSYKEWAIKYGFSVMSLTTFGTRMAKLFKRDRSKKSRQYIGITLKDDDLE